MTPSPHRPRRLLPPPPKLEAPIVLAHGFMGFSRMVFRGKVVAHYFRGIPRYLEQAGNRVVTPRVPPSSSISHRAEALRFQIRQACGQEPVHIIAHSMGGLDARYMISRLGMEKQVLSLTTLGTPHRGSPVADRILQIARTLRWPSRLVRDGYHDLRVDACAEFNAKTPDAPGVRYFSVAGQKHKREEVLYSLRFGHGVVSRMEGPNDGLVSVKSAQWGESLGVWDCDHANLIGWAGPRARLKGYARDVRPEYGAILKRLVALKA